MKIVRKLAALAFLLLLAAGLPSVSSAEVMLMVNEADLEMGITPSANFSADDWFSTPNMFTLTLQNSGTIPIKTAILEFTFSSTQYPEIMKGYMTVVGDGSRIVTSYIPNWPAGVSPVREGFIGSLPAGGAYTITNTMLKEDTPQMTGGRWSTSFKDEVMKIGYLPEGKYTLKFVLYGYDQNNAPLEGTLTDEKTFQINNPLPPELVSPDDNSDDVNTVPRFNWQRPKVSDFKEFNQNVTISYDVYLWKMFTESGQALTEEDAIVRIPIWKVKGCSTEMITFDPGLAREELVPGRKYCWQIQAFDGTGRPISITNQGKSDVWSFTVQFKAPTINEPLAFNPLNFSWTPAQVGGAMIQYRVRISTNADFSGAYKQEGIVMTSFRYPEDALPLKNGVLYYLELQATDDSGIPIGEPDKTVFTLPSTEITLSSPEDNAISPADKPTFTWQGDSQYFVVRVYDDLGQVVAESPGMEEKRWVYDGEDLKRGVTYAWNVAPSNKNGDPVGDFSETRHFKIAADDQVVLLSPIDAQVESMNPTFTWKEFTQSGATSKVTYNIVITDDTGAAIHTAAVTSATYTYPQDAAALKTATRYNWSVNAEQNGIEVGLRSAQASFVTPLVALEATEASMEDIARSIKLMLEPYPQFAGFKDKVLIEISEQAVTMTPSQFLEIFGTYKIIDVKAK